MIHLKIDDLEFYDDAVALIKSFFPRTEVTTEQEIAESDEISGKDESIIIKAWTPQNDGREKRFLHEEFKTELYRQLSKLTGRTLPWGKLTGVRPSKIAVGMLEEGYDDSKVIETFRDVHFVSENKAKLALQVAHKELDILERIDYRKGYSLYIGIPFCPTTCLYCSFTSYPLEVWKDRVEDYLQALFKEIDYVSGKLEGKRPDTVYFGGGTPTTLSEDQLDRLLDKVKKSFNVSASCEFTVEAGRPDSITAGKLKVLKKHGVQRISINPQTMNQETLDIIGRRHTVEQVIEAFAMARQCGFDNINVDLIMGLPGEDEEKIRHTLDEVKKLRPESLTVHSLAIKRAAALNVWRDKYRAYALNNTDEIIDSAAACAKDLGMEPYYMYRQKNMAGNFENVGYAIPGMECIYNILIMEEKQSIVALGAGASTKIVIPKDDGSVRIERIENVKSVKDYTERIDEMLERKKGPVFEQLMDLIK
ncbi:MAG: coproporphyrinogen dehydrogenase HemZ [Clostridia bacterium]|nr:coproporphyrinogen dehydrogenase HemZ [Clostridia bacterium]